MTKEKQLPTAAEETEMTEVEEKTEKCAKSKKQETGTAPLERIYALKAQGLYGTNEHTIPGKDHTTSQYNRHFHAKRGLRRLLLEQPSSLQRR